MKWPAETLAIIMVMLPCPTSSNTFKNNLPKIVDRSIELYLAPIGELESQSVETYDEKHPTRRYGSAVLVSPCYILTASHVVLGNEKIASKNHIYSMIFRAGVGLKAAFAGNTLATLVLSSERTSNGGNDWALMRLSSCIGKRPEFGWFDPAPWISRDLVGRTVMVVGYSGDDARGVLKRSVGRVEAVNNRNGNLKTSASTRNGQSGGAVLSIKDGEIKLVGINTWQNIDLSMPNKKEFDTYSDGYSNEFQNATIVLYLPEVRALIEKDKSDWPYENPNLKRLKATHF